MSNLKASDSLENIENIESIEQIKENTEQSLWRLHRALTLRLLEDVKSGKGKGSYLGVVVDFLRNNGIVAKTGPTWTNTSVSEWKKDVQKNLEELADLELPFKLDD